MSTPSAPVIFGQPLASNQTLEFSWSPMSGITGYRLTLTPRGGSPILRYPSADAIYWKEEGLTNNVWYEVTLEATADGSTYGDSASFRAFQPGSPPLTANASITATAIISQRGSAIVSWTPPPTLPDAEVYWYSIYARSSNPADPVVEAGAKASTQTSKRINGLNPDSAYYFEIYPVNCPGYGPVAISNSIDFRLDRLIVNWATGIFSGYDSSTSSISRGYTIKVDASNNIYVAGSYNQGGVVNVQNISGNTFSESPITIQAPDASTGFLIKYNSSGIAQWATTTGSGIINSPTVPILIYSMALDPSGNVYITGQYGTTTTPINLRDASGNTQVNSSITLPINSASNSSFFVAKYNSSGIAQWATTAPVTTSASGRSICMDSTGTNLYIVGTYRSNGFTLRDASGNSQIPSPTGINLPTATGGDAFLIKYNTNGITQWATNMVPGNSSSADDTSFGIAIDSSGSLYITGYYASSSLISLRNVSGSGQVNSTIKLPISADLAGDTFIVKYNSNGIAQWATNFVGGTLNDLGLGIAVDPSNFVYITGSYYSTSGITLQDANGDGQTPSPTGINVPASTGVYTVFLLKYDTNGISQWATYLGSDDNCYGSGITVDSSGILYITGSYRINSPTSISIQNVNGSGQIASLITLPKIAGIGNYMYLIAYNQNGIAQWGTYGTRIQANTQIPIGITVDVSRNIYTTGQYSYAQEALQDASGNGQSPSSVTLPYQENCSFLIKYNPSGQVQFACPPLSRRFLRYANINSTYNTSNGMAKDSSGNLYVIGGYQSFQSLTLKNSNGQVSNVTLPDTLTNTSFVASDIYLIKYDSSGNVVWATTFGSRNTNGDIGIGVAVDSSNNVYITGRYITLATFNLLDASGNGQVQSSIQLGPRLNGSDIFLVKYNSNGKCQWATSINTNGGTSEESGCGIAIDTSNNIYITGIYASSAQFNLKDASGNTQSTSLVTLASTGSSGTNRAFLVKYSNAGQVLWATYSNMTRGYGVAIDASNNVYLTGQGSPGIVVDASGTTQKNSSPSITISAGNGTGLIKYNSNGISQWGTFVPSSSQSNGYAVATDLSNNVYLLGYSISTVQTLKDASGTIQINSLVQLIANTGSPGAGFLIKYSSSGIVQWATRPPSMTSNAGGYGISIDPSGNVYLTSGYNSGSAITVQDVSGNTQTNSSFILPVNNQTQFPNYVLVKYNANGISQFAISLAQASGTIITSQTTPGLSCCIIGSTIYVTGMYGITLGNYLVQYADKNGLRTSSEITLPPAGYSPFLISYQVPS